MLVFSPFLCIYLTAGEAFSIPIGKREGENGASSPVFYIGCNPPSDLSLGDSQYLGSDSPYSDSEEEDNSPFYCTQEGIGKPRRPCILVDFCGVSSTDRVDAVVVSQPQRVPEVQLSDISKLCLNREKAICVGITAGGIIGCGVDWVCSCLGTGSTMGLYNACGICGCGVGTGVGCAICCVGRHYWKKHCKKDKSCLTSLNCVLDRCHSHTDSKSSEASSDEKSSSTIKQPKQCGDKERSMLLVVDKVTVLLLPGYNHKGQAHSLFGIQHMLLDTSKHVSTTVKMLGMKACSSSITGDEHTIFDSCFRRSASKKSKHIFSGMTSNIPYRIITSLDSYCSNMEYKADSGQMGVLFDLCPTLTAGFMYGRHNNRSQKTNGMQEDLTSGSVSTKKKIDSLSAVVALNTKKKGFTGHIVTYYGWGTVTNIRSVPHADCMVETKGTSEIQSMAGLIQLGYNLQLSSEIVCIPYVEYMISSIRCAGYQEHAGILPSKITRNNEQTQERSIGLHSHYKVNQYSQLQGWISYVSGQYHFAELKATLLGIPSVRYSVSIPSHKKKYSGTEIGMLHESKLTSKCTMGAHMIIHLYHNSVYSVYTGAQIRYHY